MKIWEFFRNKEVWGKNKKEQIKYYKLTNQFDQTYGGCQWGKNITHTASGKGELCTKGWIHYYNDPLLAVFLNPIQADYNLKKAHLWECKVKGKIKGDSGLKFGATIVKTIKRIPLPKVTTEQRIKIGILCALKVYKKEYFVEWAKNWLSGKDRTETMAKATDKLAGEEYALTARVVGEADLTARAAEEAALAARAVAQEPTVLGTLAATEKAALAATAASIASKKDIDLLTITKKAVKEISLWVE